MLLKKYKYLIINKEKLISMNEIYKYDKEFPKKNKEKKWMRLVD